VNVRDKSPRPFLVLVRLRHIRGRHPRRGDLPVEIGGGRIQAHGTHLPRGLRACWSCKLAVARVRVHLGLRAPPCIRRRFRRRRFRDCPPARAHPHALGARSTRLLRVHPRDPWGRRHRRDRRGHRVGIWAERVLVRRRPNRHRDGTNGSAAPRRDRRDNDLRYRLRPALTLDAPFDRRRVSRPARWARVRTLDIRARDHRTQRRRSIGPRIPPRCTHLR
jgi:hypothetical protein